MKVLLKTRRDSVLGELGLVVDGLRDIDDMPMVAAPPRAGLQIAHDLVEHVNGLSEIGGIGDELEALGAVWFVRGVTGQLRRDGVGSMHTVETHLASDVSRMALDFTNGAGFERAVPRTRPIPEAEDVFANILWAAKQDTTNELDSNEGGERFPEDYFRAATHFLRAGYRKAKRKYGSTDVANNMFWQIAEAVDRCVRHEELLGQDFELSYNRSGAMCRSVEDYGY